MLPDKPIGPEGDRKKSSKPVMEKKRRARINASLAELKSLQLEIIKKEGTRHSKMEKADILELTVRHLRQLQKQPVAGPASPESLRTNNYRLGFSDCMSEMHRFLSVNQGIDSHVKARLLDHLTNVARLNTDPQQTLQQIKSPQITNQQSTADHMISIIPYTSSYPMTLSCLNSNGPIISGTSVLQTSPGQTTVLCQPVAQNSSSTVSSSTDNHTLNSLQLLPTRLANGEMAFVLPASVPILSSSNISNCVIPVFAQSDVTPKTTSAAQCQVPVTTIHAPACFPECTTPGDTSSDLTMNASNNHVSLPQIKFNQAHQNDTGLSSRILPAEPDSTRPEANSKQPICTERSRNINPVSISPLDRGALHGSVNVLTDDIMWRPW